MELRRVLFRSKARTSSPRKRIALPRRVASSKSSLSPSKATPISRSSSSSPSNFIAILPFEGTLVNASIELRRTEPLAVANMTWSAPHRSEEHTSELQSLMRISYAVFCLKKKKKQYKNKKATTKKYKHTV